LDPGFAGGYYGLGLANIWGGWGYASPPMQGCVNPARPFAQRAPSLDDAHSMLPCVMGFVFFLGGRTPPPPSAPQPAISLNPNHAWAVGALGGLYANHGRPNEALAALSKAMRLSPHDPLTWIWMLFVVAAHFYARDFQTALDAADQLIRHRPDKSNAYRFK